MIGRMDYLMIDEKSLMIDMLKDSKTIAVVGLSDNPHRTSYQISKAMQKAGYKIIPVNPHITESLGEKAYRTIQDVPDQVDLVNVFRRSEYVDELAEEIAKTDIPYVWMQQGVYSDRANEILTKAGKKVIMNQCIKVAHAILM